MAYNKYMSKRFALTMIFVLFLLNLGVGFGLYYQAKVSADSLASSAKDAANNATSQNFLKFGQIVGKMPKTDTEGKDISGIIRYKGSIRTGYKEAAGITTVEYKILVPANVVLGYYKTQLARGSWVLEDSSSEKITFSKEKEKITISILDTTDGITTYNIVE